MFVRRAHACAALAIGFLLPMLALAAESSTDPVVARRMSAFYEMYLGRKLTPNETREMIHEFIQGHTRQGKNRDAIREVARNFGISMILLREDQGGPASLTLRDRVLEGNYFLPTMRNTLELKLLTEPDPVRVADVRTKRLMTERDVIALANIRHFATSAGEPRHKDLSRRQIEELVSLLNRGVGGKSGSLPQFFGDAATFWAGVRQQWPYLGAQQRSLARAYANNSWRVQMPVETYAALWGLDRTSAMNRWTNDVSTRIRGRADSVGGLSNLHAAMDAMFENAAP